MKNTTAIALVITLKLAMPAIAGKHRKGGPDQVQAAPSPAAIQSPSERLSNFIGLHLESLLAPLDTGIPAAVHGGGMQLIKVPVQTRADVTKLHQNFRSEASQASQEKQIIYQRAIAVTSALTAIMDEREKQLSIFLNSRTTRTLSPLDNQKTKHKVHQARQATHSEKNFFSSAEEQRWTEACGRYRLQILALTDQVRLAERQGSASTKRPGGAP